MQVTQKVDGIGFSVDTSMATIHGDATLDNRATGVWDLPIVSVDEVSIVISEAV